MREMVTAAGVSDIGCKRSANEDRILVDVDRCVFVVADGMGGERCGGRAAEIATSTLRDCFCSPAHTGDAGEAVEQATSVMSRAIQLANEHVYAESVASPECAGMGCTLSAMTISDNIATIGHVGDSRVYLYRSNGLSQLTRDDSVVANLIAAGEITPEQARSHPMRNRLTQSVGFAQTVVVQVLELLLAPGDRLLLATDGLHGVIGDAGILEVLEAAEAPAQTTQKLILAARAQGAPDNTSTIIVDYGERTS